MEMNRSKMCYIVPEYGEKSATHFAYLEGLLKLLGKRFDLRLIILRGECPSDVSFADATCLGAGNAVSRFFKLAVQIISARFHGYKTFYVHYSFEGAFIASLLSRLSGGRTFYWNCGLPWLYKRGFFRERFERMVYYLINFLVTGTDNLAKQYSKFYGIRRNKVLTAPNWIDLGSLAPTSAGAILREKLQIPEEKKVALFIHRLSKRKGADRLPAIVASFAKENILTLVIGDGPDRMQLENSIKERGVENAARFLGPLPHGEVGAFYRLADLFIMPSHEEGFPHVVLECLAYGVPCVAFDVGGTKEVLGEELQSLVVAPGNETDFIRRSIALIKAPDKESAKLKMALVSRAKLFDLPVVAEIFSKILTL